MDRQLVAEVAPLGYPDGIDLADEVGDGDVGRGQLLRVAPVAGQPVDRRVVAQLGHDGPGRGGDGCERIVVELPAADDRQVLVEQADQESGHPRLGLSALPQEHEILAGEDRVLDLWQDGLVVADDAGQDRQVLAQPVEEVGAELLLDRPAVPARRPQLADRRRSGRLRTLGHGTQFGLPAAVEAAAR